jgi:hypothetical protein
LKTPFVLQLPVMHMLPMASLLASKALRQQQQLQH